MFKWFKRKAGDAPVIKSEVRVTTHDGKFYRSIRMEKQLTAQEAEAMAEKDGLLLLNWVYHPDGDSLECLFLKLPSLRQTSGKLECRH